MKKQVVVPRILLILKNEIGCVYLKSG